MCAVVFPPPSFSPLFFFQEDKKEKIIAAATGGTRTVRVPRCSGTQLVPRSGSHVWDKFSNDWTERLNRRKKEREKRILHLTVVDRQDNKRNLTVCQSVCVLFDNCTTVLLRQQRLVIIRAVERQRESWRYDAQEENQKQKKNKIQNKGPPLYVFNVTGLSLSLSVALKSGGSEVESEFYVSASNAACSLRSFPFF